MNFVRNILITKVVETQIILTYVSYKFIIIGLSKDRYITKLFTKR